MKFCGVKPHPSIAAICNIQSRSTRPFSKGLLSLYNMVYLFFSKNRLLRGSRFEIVHLSFWRKKGDSIWSAPSCRASLWDPKMTWHFPIGLEMEEIGADEVPFLQTSSIHCHHLQHPVMKFKTLLERAFEPLHHGAFLFFFK